MSCRQQSCRKLLDGSLWHQLALAHPVMASRSPSCFAICLRSLLVWDSSAPNRDFIVLMRLSNWDPSPFDLLMQPRFQLCHVRPQPTVAGPDYPGQGSYNPKAKMAIIFRSRFPPIQSTYSLTPLQNKTTKGGLNPAARHCVVLEKTSRRTGDNGKFDCRRRFTGSDAGTVAVPDCPSDKARFVHRSSRSC